MTTQKIEIAQHTSPAGGPAAIQRALAEFPLSELPEAIVSFGGQSILVYEIHQRQIQSAYTFNKCGSGTGEFLVQQVKRLGFRDLEEAAAEAARALAQGQSPYVPASRCSVFCKSDCTHACNERKATIGQIVAGLFHMVGSKIMELLEKTDATRVWLTGSGSGIEPVAEFLRRKGVVVAIPRHAENLEAWGATLLAADRGEESTNGSMAAEMQFHRLPALEQFRRLVTFKAMDRCPAGVKDDCLLAVDVGSTTTKLVLARISDLSIVADWYGYTLGKPHLAILNGVLALKGQLGETAIEIVGIGLTGSGRYVGEAFLTDYSMLDNSGKLVPQVDAINEITCHAKAAEHFNPGVSCVLEIGGEDAKYTYLVNGVPTDFCMNEACSAGTGSFLAEVARESLGIDRPQEIAPLALEGRSPLQFGEQCSAFIQSDVATALKQGAPREDILAGLCYSICYNYLNRIVGNRPIRGPVSVQGGTAYNEAFCLAMAGVLQMSGILGEGEPLVVNRDAGLMGAIGAALELHHRMTRGKVQPIRTTLDRLLVKRLEQGDPFTCSACDYHCRIQTFLIDGHKIPFGGFCRRYDKVRRQQKALEPADYDWTMRRDELLMKTYSDFGCELPDAALKVGLLGNFFELSHLPFFSNLFARMGCKTVLAEHVSEAGTKRQGAAFCWPVERAHGQLESLIRQEPDFYWLPHLKAAASANMGNISPHCCPFVQAIPYYLGASFPEVPKEKILQPYLDLSATLEEITDQLLPLAQRFEVSEKSLRAAVVWACKKQREFELACQDEGRKLLAWLDEDSTRQAYIVFGRPYNAFSAHLSANKGISRKLASLGVPVVPLDFLPLDGEPAEEGMYWPTGQSNLRGARFVARHPQLFGVYLTNFSCGPDSFINFRFREYMGRKPSLTLEFDSHTANAGFETRIEAFADIVRGYRTTCDRPATEPRRFRAAQLARESKHIRLIDGAGRKFGLRDPAVCLVLPDMGELNCAALGDVIRSLGVRTTALPPADERSLQIGRRHSSCKECLPYNLTLGSMLQYLEKRPAGEKTLFFMPDATGPCRFGQYNVFLRHVIERLELPDVAVITLSPKNGYSGLGLDFSERAWIAVSTATAMGNIQNALMTLAADPVAAMAAFDRSWSAVRSELRRGVTWKNLRGFMGLLAGQGRALASIPLRASFPNAPKVLVTGEIYVRLAHLTAAPIVSRLTEEGFVVVQEAALNYVKYEDLITLWGINSDYTALRGTARLAHRLKMLVEHAYENRIFKALASSGLLLEQPDRIQDFIKAADGKISPLLGGEAILTVGAALHEVFDQFAGIAVIGPFGCMPTRIANAILAYAMTAEEQLKLKPCEARVARLAEQFPRPPILFYEADASPLPPTTQAQLEVFSLVAKRVGAAMAAIGNGSDAPYPLSQHSIQLDEFPAELSGARRAETL